MKTSFIISFLVLCNFALYSQDYFFKRLDIDVPSQTTGQLIEYNGKFYMYIGHFCNGLECSTLIELDEYGDTLWTKTNRDMDLGFESMLIYDDTITLTGNNDPWNTHFRMAHYDLEGNKISETMEIKHPTEEFTWTFQLTTQRLHHRYHIMGTSGQDDIHYSLMYVVDNKGQLDTLVRMASAGRRSSVTDSDIDKEGNLVTFHKLEEPFGARDYLRVISYDEAYDTVWTYTSEDSDDHLASVRGVILEDEIAITVYTPDNNSQNFSIRGIDPAKNERVIYDPGNNTSLIHGFRKIKTLSNGDILGFGIFRNRDLDPAVHSAPWVIRMSPEGDIRWQRVFYEYDPAAGKNYWGMASDAVELPNGDLLGVGEITYEKHTSFVFRIDENGCMGPDDCDLIYFITDTDDVDISSEIRLYPNPTSDYFTVNIGQEVSDLHYMIIDHVGRQLRELTPYVKGEKISTLDMVEGMYYLLLVSDVGIVGKKKVYVR